MSAGVREGDAGITEAQFPGPGLDPFWQIFEVVVGRFGHGMPVEWRPGLPGGPNGNEV